MNNMFAIIEIGSNNTKTHIYKDEDVIYENTTTIEFKKNYKNENKINENDLNILYEVINNALNYTKNISIYGCSIFRNISKEELNEINKKLYNKFSLEIQVVSQEDEANYTALGCYNNIEYNGNICVFIGGGGSIELIFVNNKKIIDKKYYNFGVVDITNKFDSLKNDIPNCSFSDVYNYVNELINDINIKSDILILAGGDHLYWYNNAGYKLIDNTLYKNEKQKYMLTIEMSDNYDKDALVTSLDRIRQNSDNPKWFDGSRAMKVITNLISHKIDAKYIIPTKINMEDGLKMQKRDVVGKVLKVREVGDPILEKECDEVDIKNINKDILDIIEDLKSTLEFGTGLGIAAPQIGLSKRIIVVGAKKENIKYNDADEIPITAMINPTWKNLSEDTDIQYEGCMSVPSIRGKVERYKNIELTYYNEYGEKIVKQLNGFFARLVQHECDHLDGIVFLEKVKGPNGFATSENIKKFNLREEK